jgi:hypothetical protein
MTEQPLKAQAQQIMTAVDRDLQQLDVAPPASTLAEVDSKANAIVKTLFSAVSDVDLQAAIERVNQLKKKYPDAPPAELAQMIIREKCRRTGTVGAVTSSAGLIPGLGTAAAVTLGVAADIGATFKLQAELVLEIAAVYDYPLTEHEKQQLVMFVTGLSAGAGALSRRAGQTVAVKIGEKVAERTIKKTVMKALPVLGVVASAGTNVLSTYIIGQRADAYFRLGPDAVGNWSDSLRAITGVDERNITVWLTDGGRSAGQLVADGAGKVGEFGKSAGATVATGVSSGAKKVEQAAKTGFSAYMRWLITFWSAVFGFGGKIIRGIWTAIAFIPRKIIGLFRRKNNKEAA